LNEHFNQKVIGDLLWHEFSCLKTKKSGAEIFQELDRGNPQWIYDVHLDASRLITA